MVEAARKAYCDDFIEALPNGYDTVIGEGGTSLSGGEKQRISIARVMLKDAPIVILDEATANVDPENEDRLQKAIEELTRDKAIIMIAHRLKTVRNADQILVVDVKMAIYDWQGMKSLKITCTSDRRYATVFYIRASTGWKEIYGL